MRAFVFKKGSPSGSGSSFTGGALISPLILANDPTQPLEAATKRYVDNGLAALNANNLTSGTVPVSRLPAFTGDVTSNAGTNTLTLTNTGVNAGTYTKVTVDAKGRVTTGGALAASDIPNLDWSKITTGKPTTLSGYGITNGVNKSGDSITGPLVLAGDPTQPLEAATKQYVDSSLAALNASNLTSGTIPIARLPAFTGDISSSAGTNALTLSNTGVNVGTYTKVTVDAKGRVTSGSALADSDIPNLHWSKITTGKPTTLSGYGITDGVNKSGDSMTGPLTLSGNATNLLHAVPLQQVNEVTSSKVSKSGDTMTGPLTLSGNATSPLHAVPLQQLSELTGGDNSIEFIASGAIPSVGLTVGLNADGTVSAITGTVQTENWGSQVNFSLNHVSRISAAYDSANQKVVIAYRDDGNGFGFAVVGTVSGNSISFGSPVLFSSADIRNISTIYDSANQKVVIAYSRFHYSSYHHSTAIVGTVSGNSISFGTPVPFTSDSISGNFISGVYDPVNQKVVIFYRPAGGPNHFAVVGTVSGNSISFGTPATLVAGNIAWVSAVYDSASQKVVIAYAVSGGHGQAVVGTVSENSISLGPTTVFHNVIVAAGAVTYDPINNKVVIAYSAHIGSGVYRLYAIVGFISDTILSFYTPVSPHAIPGGVISAMYNPVTQKVNIFCRDQNNYGAAMTGTVSGNSISLTAPVIFSSVSGGDISSVYDSTNQRVVVAYANGTGNPGSARVYSPSIFITNKNTFIGISQNSATNGDTVRVKIKWQVDSNQSGLTPGQLYYVSDNGTLTTTSTNNPLAGRAISATKLLITNWAPA